VELVGKPFCRGGYVPRRFCCVVRRTGQVDIFPTPPKTKTRKEGEKTRITRQGDGAFVDDVRYYYLQVLNERRWSPAKDVQVYLSRIEEPGPSGTLQVVWTGNIAIRWRDQEVVPLLRTIGASADCDLCRVERQGGFFLMPLIVPNNLNARRREHFRLVASLQARSTLVDSEVVGVEIAWDGLWEDGDIEMQRHLVIGELAPEKRR